jgi:Protein of unknown function (DUF3363)
MPPPVRERRNTSEDRGRSTKLRPGRVRPTDASRRRVTGTAKNLLRLVRLVSRSSSRSSRGGNVKGSGIGSSKTSPFQRRAVVNVRYSNAKTPGGWKAHGTYVERESAKAREADDAEQYSAGNDVQASSPDRLGLAKERSLDSLAGNWQKAGDKRIFKIVISPEDSDVNFQRTASDMIARIEQHTGVPVEWAGVVHRNTDHPHAHLILRGKLPSGEALQLPPMLIRKGLRETVQTSLTRQLGPRTMEDIQRQKQVELTANRVTPLDRRIAKRSKSLHDNQSYSDIGIAANPGELARLRHLNELGLAKRHTADLWLVRSNFIGHLQQMKDVQDRARTLFRSGVAISDPHAPMEFSTSSKKLIGRVLLNSEDERTGALQTIFETTEGKIEVIRHDGTLRAAWRRGDLEPGNVVSIDSLRSDPSKLYAASVGADKDILTDKQALDSVARRMRTMGLVSSETDKGWMGQFNNALRTRAAERTHDRGY